uniref:Uncharacterized protein n=1 Tax=Timema douglasi TaxID=61478 RepID=A0A7R8ZAT7_TIMDO|nr:unnamed protein product [Timema douglasi]
MGSTHLPPLPETEHTYTGSKGHLSLVNRSNPNLCQVGLITGGLIGPWDWYRDRRTWSYLLRSLVLECVAPTDDSDIESLYPQGVLMTVQTTSDLPGTTPLTPQNTVTIASPGLTKHDVKYLLIQLHQHPSPPRGAPPSPPRGAPPSPPRGPPPSPPRGPPPSPPRGPPSSPPRGTPPSPARGNNLRASAVESLILASGPPKVGMGGETGEAVKGSPTGALKKDQRETAEKNIKKGAKALTKPSRKDTTTQSLQNKPKPLLKREVQERLGKARRPKKALNQFLILRDSDMDCEDN